MQRLVRVGDPAGEKQAGVSSRQEPTALLRPDNPNALDCPYNTTRFKTTADLIWFAHHLPPENNPRASSPVQITLTRLSIPHRHNASHLFSGSRSLHAPQNTPMTLASLRRTRFRGGAGMVPDANPTTRYRPPTARLFNAVCKRKSGSVRSQGWKIRSRNSAARVTRIRKLNSGSSISSRILHTWSPRPPSSE